MWWFTIFTILPDFAHRKTLTNFNFCDSIRIKIASFNDWKLNLNIRRLAGKLETSMCLILQQSTLIIEGNENNSNYLTSAVTRQVLQSYVHRYFACSARYCTTYEMVCCCCNKIRFLCNREIQRCLVLRNAHRILNLIQRHTNNMRWKWIIIKEIHSKPTRTAAVIQICISSSFALIILVKN